MFRPLRERPYFARLAWCRLVRREDLDEGDDCYAKRTKTIAASSEA